MKYYIKTVFKDGEWVTIATGTDKAKMEKAFKALKTASTNMYIFMNSEE